MTEAEKLEKFYDLLGFALWQRRIATNLVQGAEKSKTVVPSRSLGHSALLAEWTRQWRQATTQDRTNG